MANKSFTRESKDSISNSLNDALLYLNSTQINNGKIYMKRYLSQGSKSKVDVIVALGISDGVGAACYKIISEAGRIVIWDIVDQLPDISDVLNGQFIVYTSREQNYLVYIKAGTRIVEPIKFPMITLCSGDNRLYYVSPSTVIDIYDHLENSSEMDFRLTELEKKVEELSQGGITPTPTPTPTPGPGEDEEDTTTTTTTSTTPKPDSGENPGIALKILSFTMDSENMYEVGASVNPKFSWSYNLPINTQSINGTSIESSLREKTFENVTTTTTFKLMATDGYTSADKSLTIAFSPMSYSGPGRVKVDTITSDNFYEIFLGDLMNTGFSDIECVGTVTKTFTFEQKSYVLLAFPTDKVTNLKIYDLNNFEVTWYTKEISVTNSYGKSINYTVFQSPSASTESTYVFKF